MKEEDVLWPLVFKFALEYANRKETTLGLDTNGTHQVLFYADDVNLIGDDIRTIERNSDVLRNVCNEIGLAVSTGKTKYLGVRVHWDWMANEHIGR